MEAVTASRTVCGCEYSCQRVAVADLELEKEEVPYCITHAKFSQPRPQIREKARKFAICLSTERQWRSERFLSIWLNAIEIQMLIKHQRIIQIMSSIKESYK